METLTGIAVLALAKQLMSLLKFITNKEWNGVVTIVAAWIVGAVVILMVSQTSLGKGELFGVVLSNENFISQLVIGMVLGATAGLAYDTLNAIKKTTGAEPPLVPRLANKEPLPAVESVDKG